MSVCKTKGERRGQGGDVITDIPHPYSHPTAHICYHDKMSPGAIKGRERRQKEVHCLQPGEFEVVWCISISSDSSKRCWIGLR